MVKFSPIVFNLNTVCEFLCTKHDEWKEGWFV